MCKDIYTRAQPRAHKHTHGHARTRPHARTGTHIKELEITLVR